MRHSKKFTSRFNPLCRTLVALASLQALCGAAHALDMIYTGEESMLQELPAWVSAPSRGLFAGTTDAPVASQNTVIVNYQPDATSPNPTYVFGGMSEAGSVQKNMVLIRNGQVEAGVYGGYSNSGDVSYNHVEIYNGSANTVYGGYSLSGHVTDNRVVIHEDFSQSGGPGRMYGGYSEGGDVLRNTLVLYGGTGMEAAWLYAGQTGAGGNVMDNHLVMNDGYVDTLQGGYASGSGVASGNSVTVNGGKVTAVFGGVSTGGQAKDNVVNFRGGVLNEGFMAGGRSDYSDAVGNTINLESGTVRGIMYGGITYGQGSASGNTVNIGGDVVLETFPMMGMTMDPQVYAGLSSTGDATHNTINLSGNPVLEHAVLYGGLSYGGDDFTGNTLNVNGFQGTVKGIVNFENYNFFLPASLRNGDSVLTVIDPVDISNTHIRVTGIEAGALYGYGDTFTLIDAQGGLTGGDEADVLYTYDDASGLLKSRALMSSNGLLLRDVPQGVAFLYDVELAATPEILQATVVSMPRLNPQTKSFSEGRLAGLAFAAQGSELIATQGIGSALASTQRQTEAGWSAFGAIEASGSRYNSGSYVNVNGASLLVGAARRVPVSAQSAMTWGLFMEGGMGNYDSHNSFTNAASVKGEGDTKYYGVGALMHYDAGKTFYVDGSLRVGRSDTDYDSSDLLDGFGQGASFNSRSTYYGAHIGIGKVFDLSEATRLDVYSKYLWTHQGSDSVNILGDEVRFDSSDSQRWRNGLRVMYAVSPQTDLYAGAAYEYEFDGKSSASIYGYRLDEPSIKGGTGVFELGFSSAVPDISDGLSVSFKLQGYVGKREGAGATLQLHYLF